MRKYQPLPIFETGLSGTHPKLAMDLSTNQDVLMTHPARQAMMDKAIAERNRCRDWLLPHMQQGRPKAFTKEQYRLLASAALGQFSKAAFDFAWVCAIEDSGRQDWYKPKSRRKEASQ